MKLVIAEKRSAARILRRIAAAQAADQVPYTTGAMTGQDCDEQEEDIRPGDPDYDLSEAHGYMWDPARPPFPPTWLVVAITVLVIAALVVPTLIVILSRR